MSPRRVAAITKDRQAEGGSAGGIGPHGRYQLLSRRRFHHGIASEPDHRLEDPAAQKPQEEHGKTKRFRLVRLEERIAPSASGHGYTANYGYSNTNCCVTSTPKTNAERNGSPGSS